MRYTRASNRPRHVHVGILNRHVHRYVGILNCKTINVSTLLMLAKLAMQLLLLNSVDAKQCGTAHVQSKTSTRGKKMAQVVLV